jgi:hypothetical protein
MSNGVCCPGWSRATDTMDIRVNDNPLLTRPWSGRMSDPATHHFAKRNGFRKPFASTQCFVCFSGLEICLALSLPPDNPPHYSGRKSRAQLACRPGRSAPEGPCPQACQCRVTWLCPTPVRARQHLWQYTVTMWKTKTEWLVSSLKALLLVHIFIGL